jgi:hypothetical protein
LAPNASRRWTTFGTYSKRGGLRYTRRLSRWTSCGRPGCEP